jgi:predicted DNA-binding transcriptional regulator YafY
MNLNAIAKIKRLDDLIRRKATGTLDQLAESFEDSVSTMSRHIEDLKRDFNAPVKYHRTDLTYYYSEPFELTILIEVCLNGCREKII